jgi:putative transposase
MRAPGLQGARRGKKIRTTMADPGHQRAADLVQRDFTASRPNTVWVTDFTYVHAWCGIVYVAFVVDVYPPAIVGWTASRPSAPTWCWTPWTWRCGGATAPDAPPGRA